MIILDKIEAYSHINILSTHKTTIEITKDRYLTKNGNCIIGLNALKACNDLNPNLKKMIKEEKKIKIKIIIDDLIDVFYGFGHEKLTLLDNKDMVFRKSDFICDRTVLINCTKSSSELDRKLVEKFKVPDKKFYLIFIFEGNEDDGKK